MICQLFMLDQQEILRMYHDHFADYPQERRMEQKRQLGDRMLEFKEFVVKDLNVQMIRYDERIEGFLHINHPKNPYSLYSTYYKEFIVYEKPWFEDGDLKDTELFDAASEFVKEWSGFNLKQSPYSVFNTLVYSPTMIDFRMKLDRSQPNHMVYQMHQARQQPYEDIRLSIKFKMNDDVVVDTKWIEGNPPAVGTSAEWNTIDLEVFSANDLVHANYNVSFVRSIHIDMGVVSKEIKTDLKKTAKQVTLRDVARQTSVAGEADTKRMISYLYQEKQLARRFSGQKLFAFLGKHDYVKAIEIFERIAGQHGFSEMWIFDPYFIDVMKYGKDKLNDILTVLASQLSMRKIVVYECAADKEKAKQEFEGFKKAARSTIELASKHKSDLAFTFFGTQEHFHDRFIFMKARNRLKGYMLGTSFNSFGDNYSTIVELENAEAKLVLERLISEVATDFKIILEEGL